MAGIFQPTLQSEVQYERAVEQPSSITTIAKLGTGILDSYTDYKRSTAPSASERKSAADSEALKAYTSDLDDIHQMRDSITPTQYRSKLSELNMKFYQSGVDVGSTDYSNARKLITGVEDEMLTLSENQLLINDLKTTPEGQGEIAFAFNQLKAEGIDPTDDNIATVLRDREATQAALNTLVLEDEFELRKAKPVFEAAVTQFQQDTQNAYFGLREAGVPVTPQMVQERYVGFLQLKSQIESKIPSNAPIAEREDILKDVSRMEDFFVQLGMDRENGEIVLRTKNELQLQGKMDTFLNVLGDSENAADMALVIKMSDPSYVMTTDDYDVLQGRLQEMGAATGITPEWIQEADIVVTNDLIKTYDNLIAFENEGGREAMDLAAKQREGALSLVNPEERAMWSGLSNAQGWSSTKAFSQASKGFTKEGILSGNLTDGFYNAMAGLALSFETIDIVEEPISFAGVRKEVSSRLPDMIKTAEAVDPAKGAAIRGLMYRSLVTQRFQYDERVKSDEADMGVQFNPQTGTYNLDSQTSDPRKLTLINIVNNNYNGDLVAAIQDRFRKTTRADWEALPAAKNMPLEDALVYFSINKNAPKEDDIKTALDLRNSSVYLNNLATQIEPQASKDAREIAAEAVEALNETEGTVGSVTGQLIDQFEAGSGGYKTLFAQAQDDEGGPFAGYDVTTKTLGELYEFSKPSGAAGTYGAFVKANNPEGDLATPMGRYQFVGTTLRDTAKRMGLPDETVFTPAVQDSMFLFLARDVIEGKSQEGKRKALRGTWAGFKKASDTQLNQMISEIENEDFNLGGDIIATPEVTTTELTPSASPMAVTTSLRPQERPVSDTAETPQEEEETPQEGQDQEGSTPVAIVEQGKALMADRDIPALSKLAAAVFGSESPQVSRLTASLQSIAEGGVTKENSDILSRIETGIIMGGVTKGTSEQNLKLRQEVGRLNMELRELLRKSQ